MKKLFIISNESIFNYEGQFFCDNIDMKSTPEGLKDNFEINIIARKSKKIRSHKINFKSVKTFGNIVSFLICIFRSAKIDNSKYLAISFTPFTVLACIVLKIFGKKPHVYLRSDGYGEYKSIIGFFGLPIYHIMFLVGSKISHLISCRDHILRGRKGNVVEPSRLTNKWFSNHKSVNFEKIRILYVGRIRVEKGIFSLLKILEKLDKDLSLSIVGAEKISNKTIIQKNVNVYKIETNEDNLIKFYDDHNIFVLPSYTEGHPMVLLEALARRRPVIIFKEIQHVIGNKKGIFVSERNYQSFSETLNHIKNNYKKIQEEMEKNKLPTSKEFLDKFAKSILDSN